MNRRFLLIGIILVLAGFLVAGSVWNSIGPYYMPKSFNQTVVIAPNSEVYSPVSINTSKFIAFIFNSQHVPIYFYIVNGSAFQNVWQEMHNGNISYDSIAQMQSEGILVAIDNSTRGIYPYNSVLNSSLFPAPVYAFNESGIFNSGTYDLIFRNPTNAFANTTFGYIIPTSGLSANSPTEPQSLGIASIASAVLVILGIIMFVLGLFGTGNKVTSSQREAEIAKMYQNIDNKERKAERPIRKNRRKKAKK